jgi:hypothetical protein
MILSKRLLSVGLLAVPWLAGCPSSNNAKEDGGTDGSITGVMPGGPVSGTHDDHCTDEAGAIVRVIDPASCHPEAGPDPDAGTPPSHDEIANGSEGDDDDCKYRIKWSVTPVCRDGNVTFTVTLTKKADGKPATGAHPYAEIVLPPSHTAPNTMAMSTETQPGVYTIGPHKFDQAGKWYVRFHFYADCEDFPEDSPHGHGAFFVNVP